MLFMSKFFPASARHAKAREFLELRQGAMTVLEYVAKFIELSCFTDDYVAIDMAKVRKFEEGMKLSIRGKIVGLLLQVWSRQLWPSRERLMTQRASRMRVLVERGRKTNFLLAR